MKFTTYSSGLMDDDNMIYPLEENVDITDELADTSDLPKSLIITNVDAQVFVDDDHKMKFEQMFLAFEEGVFFQYFKSFRRVRVNFRDPSTAANARIQCHQARSGDSVINCYFAQPISSNNPNDGEMSDAHLQPPSPVRQFLISPPASPPVGWEPVGEAQPCINYDLLAALSKLTPGEAHELHPPSESQPGIVVHVCEDQKTEGKVQKLKIVQTRRPDSIDSSGSSSPHSPASSPA